VRVRVRVFATDAAVGLLRRSDTRVHAEGAGAASGGSRTLQTASADGGRDQRAQTVCMRAQKSAQTAFGGCAGMKASAEIDDYLLFS
jgi:hypothetical protein